MKKVILLIIGLVFAAGLPFSSAAAYSQPILGVGKDIRSLISSAYGSQYLNGQVARANNNNKGLLLFRISRDCATGEPRDRSYSVKTEFKPYQWIYGNLQMIDLERSVGGLYKNYTCGSRWQEQCINDGSFDGYYEEFCAFASSSSPVYNNNTPAVNGGKVLYRIVRSCATRKPIGANYSGFQKIADGQYMMGRIQRIELGVFRGGKYTNYTCQDGYQKQCIDDKSFDSYYDEWCENE
jgi:hypothetical protein